MVENFQVILISNDGIKVLIIDKLLHFYFVHYNWIFDEAFDVLSMFCEFIVYLASF